MILNFLADPYYTAEADWYDSEWDETASGYQKTVQVDVYDSGEGLVQRACRRCRSWRAWQTVRQWHIPLMPCGEVKEIELERF